MEAYSNNFDHPLLVPKIVQTILTHIPPHQYKEFRKISKIWNQESCELSKVREQVTLATASKCAKYIKLFSRSPEISQDFPFLHSQFYFPKVRMNIIYNNYILRRFFTIFGPHVKHLHLAFSKSLVKMRFLRILILQNLINLESLSLTFHNFKTHVPLYLHDDVELLPLLHVSKLTIYGYGDENNLRTFLTKILTCLPNLKKIEAGDLQGRIIFDIIYGPDTSLQTIPSITELDLCAICPTQINRIIQNQLNLKSLKTELLGSVDMSDIQALLEHLAPELEELKLDFPSLSKPYDMARFPKLLSPMLCLVKLELWRLELNVSDFTNSMFPVLRKLELNLCGLSYENEQDEIIDWNNRTCLLILNVCSGLTTNLIEGLAKILPKLKKIDIRMVVSKNEEALVDAISKDFEHLVELRINDEVLAHLPINQVEAVSKDSGNNSLEVRTDADTEILHETRWKDVILYKSNENLTSELPILYFDQKLKSSLTRVVQL